MAGIESAVFAHERGGPAPYAPAIRGICVLVVVPTEAHCVRLLIYENEMLLACCAFGADEFNHRHVANELPARGCIEQCRKQGEVVRSAEGGVHAIGGEHLKPTVLHKLAREQHVPRTQRVNLNQIVRLSAVVHSWFTLIGCLSFERLKCHMQFSKTTLSGSARIIILARLESKVS